MPKKFDTLKKLDFIVKYRSIFIELRDIYGDKRILTKERKQVRDIASKAREELGYSAGTKDVLIVNILYSIFLEHDPRPVERNYYNGSIDDRAKKNFVRKYYTDFQSIYCFAGETFDYVSHNDRFILIAHKAKKELGYSESTAAVDICQVLYRIFLKEYKQ